MRKGLRIIGSVMITGLALGLFAPKAKAQQDPLYTHYMYNTLAINPAYAGSRDAMSIMGLGRFQWIGLAGAPMTQNFQVHSPIFAGLAGGLNISNDMIGPTRNTNLSLDLTYRFRIGQRSSLAVGMRGTMNFMNNDLANLELQEQNDPTFANNYNVMFGNVGAGIYYQHTNFYVGFSVPDIIQHRLNYSAGLTETRRHYYLIAGGYFPVSRTIDLKPTGLLRITEGAPVSADITLEAIFQKKVSVGLFGRFFDGMGVLLGYNVMPNFRIGYSFDFPFTELMGAGQYGSHEIMLRYDLNWGRSSKVFNPRYF